MKQHDWFLMWYSLFVVDCFKAEYWFTDESQFIYTSQAAWQFKSRVLGDVKKENLDFMILCGLCIFIITGLPSQKNPFKNVWHIPTSDFSFCSLIWEWTFDQIFIIFLDPRRIAGWELNYFHFYIADKAYVNWLSFWSISGRHLMVSFVSKQFLHACLCEAYSHLWAAVWRVHCRISGRDDGPLIRSCQRPGYSYRCDCVRRLLSAKKKQREND